MISEKVRATYQRAKVRDLYDLHRFATMPFDGHLLRRLAVLKLWQARDPFDPEVFFTRIRSGRYEWEDLRRLVRTTERLEAEQILGSIESRFAVLRELTDLEHALVADAKSGWNEPLADKLPRRSPSLPTVRRRSEANDPDGASAFDAGMIDHAGSPAEHPGSRYATFAERFSPMNRQRIQSNGPACKRGGPRDEFLQRRALSTRHVF